MATKPAGIYYHEEDYKWGMYWYLKTDPEQWPYKLVNIILSPGQPELVLRRFKDDGDEVEKTVYIFEASQERDDDLYATTRKRKEDEG